MTVFANFKRLIATAALGCGMLVSAPALAQDPSATFTTSTPTVAAGGTMTFVINATGVNDIYKYGTGVVTVDADDIIPGLTGFALDTSNTTAGCFNEFSAPSMVVETTEVEFNSLTFGPSAATCTYVYTATIPAGTAAGTYVFDPSDIDVTYIFGGGITLPVSDVSITVEATDSVSPDATIAGPAGPVSAAFAVSVSFDQGGIPEDVLGLEVSDFTVSNATIAIVDDGGAEGGSTFAVDVTPTGGTPIELTLPAGSVLDFAGNGNNASNTYSVAYETATDYVDFTADFVGGPFAPGDTATLRYTITNNHPTETLTGGDFDHVVSNFYPGVAGSAPMPTDPCGVGSTVAGTTTISFSGGTLAPAGSCQFDVPVSLPGGIPGGSYMEPTTDLDFTLGAEGALSDDAVVVTLPIGGGEDTGSLTISKSFTDDPVDDGDTVTLEYTIVASGSFTTTDIAFTDDLDAALTGLVATGLPSANVCGAGSTLSGTDTITLASGSLAADGSCTFSVTLQTPVGATTGDYDSYTSALTATRSDIGATTASAAMDTLSINGESPAPVVPGVTIVADTGSIGDGEVFTATFRFTEAVTGFELVDISVTNGSAANFQTVSDLEYTADITAGTPGTLDIDVSAGVAIDSDSNGNTAATTFSRTVITGVPDINVRGNGVNIGYNSLTPSASNHTYFGSADIAVGSVTRSFLIQNFGSGTLTIASTPVSGTNSGDFVVTSAAAGTVAPGSSTTIEVTFDPSALGGRSATLTINTDDPDEAAFAFAIGGAGEAAPEINLQNAAQTVSILTGDATPTVAKGTDFGTVDIDGGSASSTFVIQNVGTADLALDVTPVTLSDGTDFTVTTQPTGPIAASGTASFVITYDPTSAATSTIEVSIGSSDTDEDPYTFFITGTGDDNEAPSGHSVAFDASSYGATSSTAASFTIDDPEVGADFEWEITSSGGGTPVSGSGTIPVPSAGSPSEYQISGLDLSGLNDGTLTVTVTLTDPSGNAASDVTDTATLDSVGPTPALSTVSSDPVSGAFTLDVDFGESVTGFAVGDLSVTNGSASGFSDGGGGAFSATITPSGDGDVTVDVAAAAATDAFGNDTGAATQFSITNDETAPTVTISTLSTDPVSGAFTIAIDFSEDVTGFVVGDITVGNGSAGTFSGSGDSYSAEITPSADGSVTVDVAADVASDDAGNGNTAATQFSIENDETAPTVTLSTVSSDPVSGAFTLSIDFSEDVTGFVVGDLTVGNGSAGSFAGSGDAYTVTITPSADGTVTVDLAAGVAQDDAGNDNTAATQFSIENDETPPGVSISSTSPDPVSGAFTVSFSFTEDVTGFAVGDITVGNGSAGGFSGSGDAYSATITPAADGTVTVDVAAGVAQDDAGNDNTAATQFSIENDETPPSVALSTTSSDPVSGAFTVAIDFSEDVTGFVLGDISVGNGSAGTFAGTGDAYTVVITPTTDGTVTVDVAAGVAQDDAGNDNTAATQLTREADLTAPEVDSVVASDTAISVADVSSAFTLTVTFTEAVDSSANPTLGFSDDLSGTLSFQSGAYSAGDTVYTATYTILDGGTRFTDVDVDVSGVTDLAGNALGTDTEADIFSVDQRRGGITVSAAITGTTDGDFDFSGDLGAFIVSTTSQTGSESFTGLAEGLYSVVLAAEDDFTLDSISCSGGSAATDVLTGTADITLLPGEAISCEFGILADPEIDETTVPTVTLDFPSAIDDPTTLTTEFTLDNTGGTPFNFTAATDVTWLEIDPTAGAIPASGSLTFTLTFTNEVLTLAPGTYNANITITEVAPAPQRGGLSKANTLQTLVIPVTITLEPREGTLTIVATTYPDVAGDATFTYSSGDLAEADGLSLTTSSGTASSDAFTILRGNYTVVQAVPEGWVTHDISCTGDTDNGSSFDTTTGTLNIDLDPEEVMVCTFANRRDEAYVREITLSAIRSFMAARADQILTHSPRLSRRMSGGATGTPNSFSADFRDGRFQANLSTSLSAIREASRDDRMPPSAEEQLGIDQSAFGSGTMDIWFQASYSSVSDDRAGLDANTDFGIYYLGFDMMANENLLVGALLQFDTAETVTGPLRSQVEGDGWMVGPYMVARLQENLYLDARAAWGQSDNQVNPLGLYWDDFETDRWLIEANLAGDIMHGPWRFTPELGIAYFNEEQAAYTDSLGFAIPSQEITIGRVSFGPEVAYRVERHQGGFFEPYVRFNVIWDYDDADVYNVTGALQSLGDFRADARMGVQAEFANGGQLGAEITMQGVGESDFEANSAMVRVRLPLSMQ